MNSPYEGFGLVPHINFSDEMLAWLFKQMEDDGTAKIVFLEGKITNAAAWVQMVKGPGVNLFVPFFDAEPAGVCWLERFQERWAQFNFCVFKPFWGKKSKALGKKTLHKILSMKDKRGYLLDMLVGITPARNKLALRYAKACGWKETGSLPLGVYNGKTDQSEEAILLAITREEIVDENL